MRRKKELIIVDVNATGGGRIDVSQSGCWLTFCSQEEGLTFCNPGRGGLTYCNPEWGVGKGINTVEAYATGGGGLTFCNPGNG